ncbi:Uma2 family endonuclease [Trichocoleus sp. FACHB-262]|uniref:Uma2 family endonuclease n=1 Tax=Trichocoleus sp. FACHB-262 TaxID=2692869 RepID=UPI001687DA0B|nr:Uma2 family endonuclease [Trichocoleus sp. FACHB-262]MBD2119395.1 Uma2 family endonuclease [Trichocoleus sp. FACHB-262]
MISVQTTLPTNIWVSATWEEYEQAIASPAYTKAKGYYHNGQMRIEMSPVGPNHATDNSLIDILVNLFGIAKGLPMRSLSNCSYRKRGVRECQPDLSYYIGDRASLSPQGSSVVDLDSTPAPDLAIEIADTSLADDLGVKRLLYEDVGVAEYWVVDVQQASITAFRILPNRASQRIAQSQVLPGLAIALLEEALQRSRQMDNSHVGAWFMAEAQKQ